MTGMSQKLIDYLGVFVADERFAVFALASILLAVALVPLMRGAGRVPTLLAVVAALLLVSAFVILAPLSALSWTSPTPHIHPVALSFNCGFLALGVALSLKFFRSSSSPK
jgi:hypothetical protein